MDILTWNIGWPVKELVTAQLRPDGTFVVIGNGDTEKYVVWEQLPWKNYRDRIRRVRFEDGVCPTSISSWFYGCDQLHTVENFPDSIQNMSIAFCGCTALASLPELPDNVTDLDEAFIDCCSLTRFPVIPEKVIYTCDTFVNCANLTGRMLLKANLRQYAFMFQDACTKDGNSLIIDYAEGLEQIVEKIIATGTDGSHLEKGEPVLL
ncbi:leucine-rich repeat domain-containing protein [bacterium 210820-DFI.6.37]|nr:leucine-rich repeat domain-containing protein [bacterium 210820-DFI.6.37]